jgi:HAD superfamily hydrolase (TIGR01509 family)
MLRATVFDLDDTLLDSGPAWDRVCGGFAARHGHRWSAGDSAVLQGNGGWPRFVAGLCGGAVTAAEVLATCTAVMALECAAGRVEPLPGALRLVEEAERHGPIGLATASPRRYVRAAVESLGLASRLGAVVCGEDVVEGKPAPEAYLRAAAGLGVGPEDCLAVEDSPNGIRAASAAGMRVLAVPRVGMPLPADVAKLLAAQAPTATEALPLLAGLLAPASEPFVREGAAS